MMVLDHVLIMGLDKEGNVVATGKARINRDDRWDTPKRIKKFLQRKHKVFRFKRQNIWRQLAA